MRGDICTSMIFTNLTLCGITNDYRSLPHTIDSPVTLTSLELRQLEICRMLTYSPIWSHLRMFSISILQVSPDAPILNTFLAETDVNDYSFSIFSQELMLL